MTSEGRFHTVLSSMGDRSRQTGVAAAEYLGALLLVSVIVAVLVTSGVGGQIAGGISGLVCRIGGGECESGQTGRPGGLAGRPMSSVARRRWRASEVRVPATRNCSTEPRPRGRPEIPTRPSGSCSSSSSTGS